MDVVTEKKPVTFSRWLPYWAVFQFDVRQTLQSWVYRFWVLLAVLAMAGYWLYNCGYYHEVGIIESASLKFSNLLRWIVLGSAVIICALTAGSTSSERGTMADSVLSRGISRYQYFLGKWTARLALVMGTFLLLAVIGLFGSVLLLHSETLSLAGSLVAVATVAALLAMIISFGVTVSAMSSNTMVSIAIVWMALYCAGFVLSLLPETYRSPDRALQDLHYV